MEQPCYKCGQLVVEGRPFCPHCFAPQIRVLVAEPVATPAPLTETSTAAPDILPASETVPVLAVPRHWSHALRPCALAAFVASLLMSLGLNPFVAMFSVGFLAVVFYRQGQPTSLIKAATGARLGALSGLLWFAMSSILEALVVLLLHKGPELRKGLTAVIEQAASRTSDPQALAIFDRLKTPEGIEVLMVFGLISGFVASILLAVIGGALGGAIFRRRNRS